LTASTGCGPKETRIELTAVADGGIPEYRFADFDRAYYRQSSDGTIGLVLIGEEPDPADPGLMIRQVLYIKSFWSPRPGRTYVEETQVNAQARYAYLTPPTGVRYDGGAFVVARKDKRTDELIGKIESGMLRPRYRMGEVTEPFGPARFKGTFRASHRPGEVVEYAHMLDAQFSKRLN
jgi:hypothetical protein